jgi:hypothetical protein
MIAQVGAVLRAHVADGGAVRERHVGDAGPVELDELADDALLASSSVTVSTRSVAVAPAGSSPVSLKPTTFGMIIDTGLAEHRGLGLDAADAPADDGRDG